MPRSVPTASHPFSQTSTEATTGNGHSSSKWLTGPGFCFCSLPLTTVLLPVHTFKRVRARRGKAKPLGSWGIPLYSLGRTWRCHPRFISTTEDSSHFWLFFYTKGQSDASTQIKITLLTWATMSTSVHFCSPHSHLLKDEETNLVTCYHEIFSPQIQYTVCGSNLFIVFKH